MENNFEHTVSINGKEFDLTNLTDALACKTEVSEMIDNSKENNSAWDQLFTPVYEALLNNLNNIIDDLEAKQINEQKKQVDINDIDDLSDIFDDNQDDIMIAADDYLTDSCPEYNKLDSDAQVHYINIIADAFRWYKKNCVK